MANHLIIGLGGTGGKIIRAMRKRIYEEFGTNTPEDTTTHVEYLYVDSDKVDLEDKSSWTCMGNPVYLTPSQKVNINGINGGVLANIDAYPGIGGFINPEDLAQLSCDAMAGIITTGIGGQRRRFGRILLANNEASNRLNGFSATLKSRIISLTQANRGEGKITFHIVAGLAGGTGSGTIVDAIAQLHKIIEPMGSEFEVFLYLYVPEVLVPAREDARYYHANGYAALQEINAISLMTYHPTDITGEKDPATGQVRRLINTTPFKIAYLFSNHNEASMVLSKKTKLPSAVADFLFQRTYGQESGASSNMQRLINMENSPGVPERNEEGENVHDLKFMSFGIVRIVYPETEIKEYINDRCSDSVLKGLLYNMWVQNSGYKVESEDSAGLGISNEVNTPGFIENMWLSVEHLTLQRSIADYPGSDDYNKFEEYWTYFCNFWAEDVMESNKNHVTWVPTFEDLCRAEYDNNFRDLGVKRYFSDKRQQREVRRFVNVICDHIERTIFNEWITGIHSQSQKMSLQKVLLYIRELEKATRERIPKIGDGIAVLVKQRNDATDEAIKVAKELNDAGFILSWLYAKKNFMKYASLKAKIYTCDTTIEAYEFAKLVLAEIVVRLNAMAHTVTLLMNMFNAASEAAIDNAANMNRTTTVAGEEVEIVVKKFDPQAVESCVQTSMVTDETMQEKLVRAALNEFKRLAESTGKTTMFDSLYEKLGGNQTSGVDAETENVQCLLKILDDVSRDVIDAKLNQLAQENTGNKIMGVDILERINDECPTNQQLEEFIIRNIRDQVRCFLQFDDAQTGKGNIAIPQSMQIVLPGNTSEQIRNRFINVFGQQFEGSIFTLPDSVSLNDEKSNEIVVITMKGGFPLRVIKNLSHLKQKYDDLVSVHNPEHGLNRVLLHTESQSSRVLPSLFDEDPGERRRRLMLVSIKLYAIPGLIQPGVDPESGDEVNVVTIGKGFDAQDEIVGKNAVETTNMLNRNPKLRRLLATYVDETITERYRTTKEKNELKTLIEQMVCTDILKAFGGNKLSNEYKEYVSVAKEYINTLN